MAEYIDREALITKFKKMELGEHGLVERLFADGVYAVIAAFPAADVAPVVHGRWLEREDPMLDVYYVCSVCKEAFYIEATGYTEDDLFVYTYCPNCGAKMDEKVKPEPSEEENKE